MGCATGLVKFFLFLFNFIFVAGGVGLIALGTMFYTAYKNYETLLPELGPYQLPPLLMIVVGSVIFLISFMGCCGVIRESKCMMMTYATVLMLLLIGEIAIVVLVHYYQDDFKDSVKNGLEESISKWQDQQEVRDVWDTMQTNFKCCGANGPRDWMQYGRIPQSCCESNESCDTALDVVLSTIGRGNIYSEGCVDQIFKALKTEIAMYLAGGLALVELLGVIFGCCLGARFGRKYYHT